MTLESHIHWSFNDEHVLLPNVVLNSFGSFIVALLLVVSICLLERFLTFLLERQWAPRFFELSRISLACWRTGLYSLATFLRLCYMLVAMTFQVGLLATIVITLSAAQFAIELHNLPKARDVFPQHHKYESVSQPLFSDEERTYPPTTIKTRPRSKSKPDDIFIHPTQSNIARADAVALEMGIAGETERVQANSYTREEPAWEVGKGRDMARELLLGSQNKKKAREPFYINGSDSDSS